MNVAGTVATGPTLEKKKDENDLNGNWDLLKKTEDLLKRAKSECNSPLLKAKLSPKNAPKSCDESESDYYMEKMVEAQFYKSTCDLPKEEVRHRFEAESEVNSSPSYVRSRTIDAKQRCSDPNQKRTANRADKVPCNYQRRVLTVERMNAQRLVSEKLKKPPGRLSQPQAKPNDRGSEGTDEFPVRQSSSITRQNDFMDRHFSPARVPDTRFCPKRPTRGQCFSGNRAVSCRHCQFTENSGAVFKCKPKAQKHSCKNKLGEEKPLSVENEDANSPTLETSSRTDPSPRSQTRQSGLTMKDLETNVKEGGVAPDRKPEVETGPEAKKLDAATNTEVRAERRPNTAVINVVSSRDESGQDAEEDASGGRSFMRVQHLPRMNIRPQLSRQLGTSVDIPTAVEEFAKRNRNNVALYNYVHGTQPVNEHESVYYYASEGSAKEDLSEPVEKDRSSSLNSSCSQCKNCPECRDEKLTGTEKTLHDAAVSLSEKLNTDCDQDICSFREALHSLVKSLHETNTQHIKRFRESSKGGKDHSYVSSRMRLVANLLEEELETGANDRDHYAKLNNLIRHLILDIRSNNWIYEQRRKKCPKPHDVVEAPNAGVSSGIGPSTSNHHQELKTQAKPSSSYPIKTFKKQGSSGINNRSEESGSKQLIVTKSNQLTQVDGEITVKIPTGESYAKHSVKKPETHFIPYRHLLPSRSKDSKIPVIPEGINDLKHKNIEQSIDDKVQLKSMELDKKCESPTAARHAVSKNDVSSDKLNETFILTGEGDETEASSQNKSLPNQHVSKEATDNDYEDDWESDEELNTSGNISHSIKNEGSIIVPKPLLNSSDVEQKVVPSKEITSVSVEQQKTKENVREPNGTLEPSKQKSVFRQNIDKNVDNIHTDSIKCKEPELNSHESTTDERTQSVLTCFDLNPFPHSIEASSIMKHLTVLKNSSLNDTTSHKFQLNDFSKIIDEIKNNFLTESKIKEYVNEKIEKCLSKTIDRPEFFSENNKIAGYGGNISNETLESSKDCRTKLEIRLPTLSNPFGGIVSFSKSDEENEIKLSLTMPETIPEQSLGCKKRFSEQSCIREMPQLSNSSSDIGCEMGLTLEKKCNRSTMTERVNQDTTNQTQLETKLIESITTNILKDVLEGLATTNMPNPTGGHNCCTNQLQVTTSLSKHDQHNKENILPVEKLSSDETDVANFGPLKIQSSDDVTSLTVPGVSLSVVNCSKEHSEEEQKENSMDINNEIVEAHRVIKDLEVFLKPTDKKENECDIKCGLTLSPPKDMLRINTNVTSDNSQAFDKVNVLTVPNDLPLEIKRKGKRPTASLSLVKITTSFDIHPENNIRNDLAIPVERQICQQGQDLIDNQLSCEKLNDSFDLVPGAIQQLRLEDYKNGNEKNNRKISNTSPKNFPDNNKKVSESSPTNLDEETMPSIKKRNCISEDYCLPDVAELSSVKSSENRANLGVPYYDTDNMSDGEVGYASTLNSYSSGEIKPRHFNQTGNSSNSSLSSMNVDDFNESQICETLSKIGLNMIDVKQNSGPVHFIEDDLETKVNNLPVHNKINKSKENTNNILKNLTHGDVSCSDFEIPTESGSDDSESDLNITHLMKLLHDCKSSLTDSMRESPVSHDSSVDGASPVK